MVRKQSHPDTCMFLSHRCFLMWLSTTARAGDTFSGILVVMDSIPIATMEMCRRTHKPMAVVCCMRASDTLTEVRRAISHLVEC